ncbi:MAG: hypothetical protein CL916_15385 [Deltaproteobacteria bacterium]|nr:hypothetical protein [Deltaproteobacteria bacterium]
MLPRLHLFEWEDLPTFPRFLRDALTSYLSLLWTVGGFYKKTIPILKKALETIPNPHITDLCSGAGGAIPLLFTELKRDLHDIHITLSDQYPNLESFQTLYQQSNGAIDHRKEATDARSIETPDNTVRTMFLALHHFSPSDAQKIFQNSINHNNPIVVFEIQQRNLFDIILMLIHIPISMIVLPFTKPCWKQVLCTYLIPIIPLCITWDGMISSLRTYSKKELFAMTGSCNDPGYQWTHGTVSHPLHSVSYFMGLPPRKKHEEKIQSN